MASIFTRIINGELPCEKVLETDGEFAFLDINPYSEGHTLVVPKREVGNFDQLTPAEAQSLIVAVQRVATALTKAMGTPHYNLSLNNGAPAGQEVFHVHFHVVPRWEGKRRLREPYADGRMGEVGQAIRDALAQG